MNTQPQSKTRPPPQRQGSRRTDPLTLLAQAAEAMVEGERGQIRIAKITNHKYLNLVKKYYGYDGSKVNWSTVLTAVRNGECEVTWNTATWIAIAVGSNGERESYVYLIPKGDNDAREKACRSLKLLKMAEAQMNRVPWDEDFADAFKKTQEAYEKLMDAIDGKADFIEVEAMLDELRIKYGRDLVDAAVVAHLYASGTPMPLMFIIDEHAVIHARLPDYLAPTRCLLTMCGWA